MRPRRPVDHRRYQARVAFFVTFIVTLITLIIIVNAIDPTVWWWD